MFIVKITIKFVQLSQHTLQRNIQYS